MVSKRSDGVPLLQPCDSTSDVVGDNSETDNLYIVEPLQPHSDQAPTLPQIDIVHVNNTDDNSNCCRNGFCCEIYRSISWRKRLIVLCSCLISCISAVCYTISLSFLPFECEKRGGKPL